MSPRWLAFVVPFLFAGVAQAADPVALSHTGYLLAADDQPLDTASLSISVGLFQQASGLASGETPWTSGACAVPVRHGYYALELGAGCGPALTTDDVPPGSVRYLEVTIGLVTLAPRVPVHPAPAAAIAAKSLDTQALRTQLAATGAVNTSTNPVDWSQLKNVPLPFADGTDDGATYAADGTTLALTTGTFSVKADGITAAKLAADDASIGKLTGGAVLLAGGLVSVAGGLEVGGRVRVGDAAGTACGSGEAGQLRFHAGLFEGCTGSAWLPLTGTVPAVGGTQINFDTVGTELFTVPAGVTWLQVEAWGGGGAGGGSLDPSTGGNSTAGGGGGGYSTGLVAVTPGQQIPVIVGSGGFSSNGASGTPGGTSSFGSDVVAGGGLGSSVGNGMTSAAGGAGGRGNTSSGLQGASSAGSSNLGGMGGRAGGAAGGAGGAGGGGSSSGSDGVVPGGGGGGCGYNGATRGGYGARGRVIVRVYTVPTGTATWPLDFTTPGTSAWIAPAGVDRLFVEVWGAGGAGGGSLDPSTGGNATAGGGAGGYSAQVMSVTAGQSYQVIVGAGGVSANGSSGTNGGGSSFGGTVLAGGGGGAAVGNGSTSPAGGSAGTGTTMGGTPGGAAGGGSNIGGTGGNAGGPGGGLGGAAGAGSASGTDGQSPGGGGGGCGYSGTSKGGDGGHGRVRIRPATLTAGTLSPVSFTQPGVHLWQVPAGVTSITAKVWGAGGGGGGSFDTSTGGNATGGGGGGGYSQAAVTVTPGTIVTITVGAGGLSSNGSPGLAGGGSSFGAFVTASGGSGAAVGSGTVNGPGGNGGAGSTASGAAGAAAAGSSNLGGTGGTAGGVGGGAGGAGGAGSSQGGNGGFPGGGGGGTGYTAASRGGNGGDGQVVLLF